MATERVLYGKEKVQSGTDCVDVAGSRTFKIGRSVKTGKFMSVKRARSIKSTVVVETIKKSK